MKTNALSTRRRWLAVLGGGFFGAMARYGLSAAIQSALGNAWPADILIINLTGAFVLALLTLLADTTTLIGPTRRLLLNVGFLGAYTTFSSLALGDVLLLGSGHWLAAGVYLFFSLGGGLLAIMLGSASGRWLSKALQRGSGAAQHKEVSIPEAPPSLAAQQDEPAGSRRYK